MIVFVVVVVDMIDDYNSHLIHYYNDQLSMMDYYRSIMLNLLIIPAVVVAVVVEYEVKLNFRLYL